MSILHLVRIGAFNQIGRFQSVDSAKYPRDARVVCRTERGLEVGQVLSYDEQVDAHHKDGDLLRGLTGEDELLQTRLDRHKKKAIRACERLLRDQALDVALIDAELLFDGKSLFFYFVGEVDERVQSLTEELAATYEAKAKVGQFADLLSKGCGPQCGTAEGSGCATGGCSGCATSGGCATSAVARASSSAN